MIGAVDETFLQRMMLVFMDLATGDVLMEEVAVDRSSSPTRGTVYIAWSDGVANIVPDLPFFFGSYAYPDVRVASSTDKGTTFSTPVTVSPAPADFTGRGRDQFFPGIAVDRKGQVGVCYYDRRQSPDNTSIDRYCSV